MSPSGAGLADVGFDQGVPGTADVPGTTITDRDAGGTVVTSSIASLGVQDETVTGLRPILPGTDRG